jgi:hypothetical protein
LLRAADAGVGAFHAAVRAAGLTVRTVPETEWARWGAADALVNLNSPRDLEQLRRHE